MIIFRNKGVIDPKSITTFGVSSPAPPWAGVLQSMTASKH